MTNEQYLKSALSFFGYQIDDKFAKIITEVFPLVQSKSGEVTIMDLCAVMVKVEPVFYDTSQRDEETEVEKTKYPEQEEQAFELAFALTTAISHFEFTERARNVFRNLEIRCLRDLYEYTEKTLIQQRGVGKGTLNDIQKTLGYHNLPKLK